MNPRMKRSIALLKGRSPRVWARALLLVLILATLPLAVHAGDGDLDPTFGEGGKVITPFKGGEGAQALAVQSDGKIVAAGYAKSASSYSVDFALARYCIDGTPDSTFGIGGKVLTDFGYTDAVKSLVVQPDGKIVAAGYAYGSGDQVDFALARYNADGGLDIEFGSKGLVTTDFADEDYARALTIQQDGKFLVVGDTWAPATNSDFAIARYHTNGILDVDFGSGGRVTTDFTGESDRVSALALQSDGKFVVVGSARNSVTGQTDFALARYSTTGSLDADFGVGGKVTANFGMSSGARAVLVQGDGKIVLAGQVNDTANGLVSFALARYKSDGSLDSEFGVGGKVTTTFGSHAGIYALTLQKDGKLIAAGYMRDQPPFVHDFALARYNSDGSLDPDFGVGGKVTTDLAWEDTAFALAMQPNGRLVAAGYARDWETQEYAFALARYLTPLSNPVYLPMINP